MLQQTPPSQSEARFIDGYFLHLLARASHLISASFHDQLRRRGVQIPVWRVLASLVGSPHGSTVTGLAEVCLLRQPTMTKLLDRMVRDGLVQRNPDERDRRIVRVVMTARGEAMAEELIDLARTHERDMLAQYPEADAVAVKALLRGLMERQPAKRRSPRELRSESVAF